MKNIILSMAVLGLLCLSATGYARDLNQGTIEIGGGSGFSMDSFEFEPEGFPKTEVDITTLSARALYYVVQNIGVGIAWDYTSAETTFADYKAERTDHFIGPTAAYNISLNDRTSVKLLGAFVMASTDTSNTISGTSTIDGVGWTTGGQLIYFPNDFVSLNGSLQYRSVSLEDPSENSDTKTNVDETALGAGVGLSVYLK